MTRTLVDDRIKTEVDEDLVHDALNKALERFGLSRWIDQFYANELVAETYRAMHEDDMTLDEAAGAAVQYWREWLS